MNGWRCSGSMPHDLQRYQGLKATESGRLFEKRIEGGAQFYNGVGRANIIKVPEPFRVMKKGQKGIAVIRFTARAQPDFIGCIAPGRAIAFEAKHTEKDRLYTRVVTATQAVALDEHQRCGAIAAVCVGIKDDAFMIPWSIFRSIKALYGRQYITAEDVLMYKVKANGMILFLDYADKLMGSIADGTTCKEKEDKHGDKRRCLEFFG